jgi:DNA-binding NtrC family response regulator
MFRALPWPGNVRQVLNVIRNVVVLNPGGMVTLDMLPPDLAGAGSPQIARPPTQPSDQPTLEGLLGRPLAEIERIVVMATLARYGGSVPKAARVLDLSPSTLYRKLESWGKSSAS